MFYYKERRKRIQQMKLKLPKAALKKENMPDNENVKHVLRLKFIKCMYTNNVLSIKTTCSSEDVVIMDEYDFDEESFCYMMTEVKKDSTSIFAFVSDSIELFYHSYFGLFLFISFNAFKIKKINFFL